MDEDMNFEANRVDPVWNNQTEPVGGKVPVAILGATGSVGQRFIQLLSGHPWFEIRALTASGNSAGKRYADAAPWMQTTPIPRPVQDMVVRSTEPSSAKGCRLVFSALGSKVAGPVEPAFAKAGFLVATNASSHRMDPDVPLLVPEVNADHLDLCRQQRFGDGAILANPNCSTIGLTLALKPLAEAYGVDRVSLVSLQALSGAGLRGVPGVQVLDNLIPFIPSEEDKLESESRKILGRLKGDQIEPDGIMVSATCTRVPVVDGHTLCVSVSLKNKAKLEDLRGVWESYAGQPQRLALPSAPRQPVHYLEGDAVPQPRVHRDLGRGMAVSVGRVRPCSLFDFKFVTLSHNTIRGAAGGALLVGELALARGFLEGVRVAS